MNATTKRRNGSIDRKESFDEFLAKEGLLTETEDAAIKDIVSDRTKFVAKNKS